MAVPAPYKETMKVITNIPKPKIGIIGYKNS
jgi:hypothetical protein